MSQKRERRRRKLLATLSMTLVRERFRRLCHCCMWKTVTLRDCWSTRRGGDILHFQAYILGHAKLIDRDNILNSSDWERTQSCTSKYVRGGETLTLLTKKEALRWKIEGKHQNFHFPDPSFYKNLKRKILVLRPRTWKIYNIKNYFSPRQGGT